MSSLEISPETTLEIYVRINLVFTCHWLSHIIWVTNGIGGGYDHWRNDLGRM